ncbi:hypothetical protein SVI_0517 [Shewanella violacea DSS12]|uniref:Uncharacterized protein n=1 Tax=Shewanella violacea (strain JCM 10179 / CIP 106290 / LMG 19151 / DSS12) TaxID=637905 RepID=D4ZFN9_SHEVD|nr:hypothetical protein SVI_0517 [Shewanella violacea DSS12]
MDLLAGNRLYSWVFMDKYEVEYLLLFRNVEVIKAIRHK